MKRGHPVTELCDRAYIYNLYFIRIRLREYGLGYVLRGRYIDLQCLLRIIVSRRRDHTSYVQHIIGSGYTFKYVFISRKITPDHSHSRIIHIWFELLSVYLARAGKNTEIEPVPFFIQFLKSCPSHITGRTGQKHSMFVHNL